DKGIDLMEAKRFDGACPNIAESYRLDPYPGTLFTLAECEAMRGRIATAVVRYDEYLALYDTLPSAEKAAPGTPRKDSPGQKAALGPQIPTLTLVLAKAAPGETAVKLDGVELAKAAVGVAQRVDPGEHVVTTEVPGGEANEVRVMIGKGEKKEVTLLVTKMA